MLAEIRRNRTLKFEESILTRYGSRFFALSHFLTSLALPEPIVNKHEELLVEYLWNGRRERGHVVAVGKLFGRVRFVVQRHHLIFSIKKNHPHKAKFSCNPPTFIATSFPLYLVLKTSPNWPSPSFFSPLLRTLNLEFYNLSFYPILYSIFANVRIHHSSNVKTSI